MRAIFNIEGPLEHIRPSLIDLYYSLTGGSATGETGDASPHF